MLLVVERGPKVLHSRLNTVAFQNIFNLLNVNMVSSTSLITHCQTNLCSSTERVVTLRVTVTTVVVGRLHVVRSVVHSVEGHRVHCVVILRSLRERGSACALKIRL